MFPTADVFGDHSTSCQEASGSLRTELWHDPMVRIWLFLMRGAGIRCDKELQGVVIGSGKRPDIVVPATHGSAEVWYDLRTCTPTSPSNCKRAAMEPGYAARRGNELKDDKYAENACSGRTLCPPISRGIWRFWRSSKGLHYIDVDEFGRLSTRTFCFCANVHLQHEGRG